MRRALCGAIGASSFWREGWGGRKRRRREAGRGLDYLFGLGLSEDAHLPLRFGVCLTLEAALVAVSEPDVGGAGVADGSVAVLLQLADGAAVMSHILSH